MEHVPLVAITGTAITLPSHIQVAIMYFETECQTFHLLALNLQMSLGDMNKMIVYQASSPSNGHQGSYPIVFCAVSVKIEFVINKLQLNVSPPLLGVLFVDFVIDIQ